MYTQSKKMPVLAIQRSATSIPRPLKGLVLCENSPYQPPLEVSTRTSKTAYRLPKLKADEPVKVTASVDHKVWSRHGYDYYSDSGRQTRVSVISQQPYATPRLITLDTQQVNLIGSSAPKFQSAMITPIRPPQNRYYAGNVTDPALYKHMLSRNKTMDSRVMCNHGNDLDIEERGPLPTPVPGRRMSPPKSAHSIHWTLSPMKNLHYDKRGKSKVQGPYSREFSVTCMAPNNWLRMKLGRSKTSLV